MIKPPRCFYKVGIALKAGRNFGYSQIISEEGNTFELLTDFGNIVSGYTYEDLVNEGCWPIGYFVDDYVDHDNPSMFLQPNLDVVERFTLQQELLEDAKERLVELGFEFQQ
jgi:hypothetical protein